MEVYTNIPLGKRKKRIKLMLCVSWRLTRHLEGNLCLLSQSRRHSKTDSLATYGSWQWARWKRDSEETGKECGAVWTNLLVFDKRVRLCLERKLKKKWKLHHRILRKNCISKQSSFRSSDNRCYNSLYIGLWKLKKWGLPERGGEQEE